MDIPLDPLDELARIYAHAAVDAFLEEQFRLNDESQRIARHGVSQVPAPSAVAHNEAEQADARFPDP